MTSSDLICIDCLHGKHSHHKARWGGICIGCACAYEPLPDAAEGTGMTADIKRITWSQAEALNAWNAGDGTVWLFVSEANEWTGWTPNEDGVWIKTPAEMDEAYPDHPRIPLPSDAVRDLATPSVSSRPSPGATDPRVEAADAADAALIQILAMPCVMFRQEPFDFAWCETHDETFPLGDVCRYHPAREENR